MKLENNTTIFVKDINEFRKVVSVLEQPLYTTIDPDFSEPNGRQFIDEEVSIYVKNDEIHWCNNCYVCLVDCIKKDYKMIEFEEFISTYRQIKLERILDERKEIR